MDKGNRFGIHTEQRDAIRPFNYPTISNVNGGDGSDVGAFEKNTEL